MILFVHQGSELGGAERMLEAFAARLDETGIEIGHFCPSPGRLSERLEQTSPGRCFVFPTVHRRRDIVAVLRAARFLRHVMRTRGATVVVANAPRGYLYAALASFRLDVPTVQVIHDPVADSIWLRLSRPSATVFASHRAHDESAPVLQRRPRARVINAAIDPARIDAAIGGAERTVDPLLLVNVSRLQEHKGHDTLLRAFALVRDELPDARLVCVGERSPNTDPAYFRELESLAGDGVTLAGFLSDDELYPLVARAAALVHAARHESLGLVLLEAMYLGRPVVATRAEGPSRIVVDGETGLLVPVDDTNALAAAMLRVLREQAVAEQLGANGRERFDREFAPEATTRALLEVLRELR